MNENQNVSNNLLDTTDCLEAVGVFKGWKNFFFVVIVICLLLLQVCFWLVNLGCVPIPPDAMASDREAQIDIMPVMLEFEQDMSQDANEVAKEETAEQNVPFESDEPARSTEAATTTEQPTETSEAAVVETAETEQPEEVTETEEAEQPSEPNTVRATIKLQQPLAPVEPETEGFLFGIRFGHLTWTIRFANALLILTATLYCLTMLFSLKVSMLGRLGGINHITRAFFLSLLMLVLLLPWQRVFSSVIIGAIFTPGEMVEQFTAKTPDLFDSILYYLRFCGFWLLIVLLLILAQIRSSRWAGAILRRLEII